MFPEIFVVAFKKPLGTTALLWQNPGGIASGTSSEQESKIKF